MKEKTKGLIIDIIIYALAFGLGVVPFIFIENIFLATALFTIVATIVTFIFSVIFKDVSIYDPYWSVAPVVMIILDMIKYKLWNINSIIIFAIILIWAIRLTVNWFITYKGLGYEDWRYRKYREKYNPFIFQVISFVGLHFIPTIVVYSSLVSAIFAIQVETFSYLSIIGIVISLFAVTLEFISDTSIHKFLKLHQGEHKTCNISVWKYSRHPNYLGEMSFWIGLYFYFLFINLDIWYLGLGVLLIVFLFLFISIPLMEKHNLERREDYQEYKEKTSMILMLPNKK